jgi:hypothetical protein
MNKETLRALVEFGQYGLCKGCRVRMYQLVVAGKKPDAGVLCVVCREKFERIGK